MDAQHISNQPTPEPHGALFLQQLRTKECSAEDLSARKGFRFSLDDLELVLTYVDTSGRCADIQQSP